VHFDFEDFWSPATRFNSETAAAVQKGLSAKIGNCDLPSDICVSRAQSLHTEEANVPSGQNEWAPAGGREECRASRDRLLLPRLKQHSMGLIACHSQIRVELPLRTGSGHANLTCRGHDDPEFEESNERY
jgi:hypothetical protein